MAARASQVGIRAWPLEVVAGKLSHGWKPSQADSHLIALLGAPRVRADVAGLRDAEGGEHVCVDGSGARRAIGLWIELVEPDPEI